MTQYNETLKAQLDSKPQLTFTLAIPMPKFTIGDIVEDDITGVQYQIENIDFISKVTTRNTSYPNPDHEYIYICSCGSKLSSKNIYELKKIKEVKE